MSKKKPVKIPSWCMFGTHSVSIDAHKVELEDETIYQVSLTFMLDDGEEVSEDPDQQKVITIFTDRFVEDIEDELREAVRDIANVFDGILRQVHVFNQEGEVLESIDLESFMNPATNGKKVGNATFH